MACQHRFYNYLNLENLNFEPETLIIGTFNPSWPLDNYAKWFYGRTNNNYFWEVLPRIFNEPSLKNADSKDWKNFCNNNKIAITDLIASITDAYDKNPLHVEVISNFKDAEFEKIFNEFEITNIINLLDNNKTIKAVYFTRQSGVNLFDCRIKEIIKYCNEKDIYFSNLITPSKNARFQMRGYAPKIPNLERNLPNFIYEKWLQNWNI
jgi:hypothetical protein